jgi:hypothetical protein
MPVEDTARIDNRQVPGYLYQMLNLADGLSLLAVIEKKMAIRGTGDPNEIYQRRAEATPELKAKIKADTGASFDLFVVLKEQEIDYEILKMRNSVSREQIAKH